MKCLIGLHEYELKDTHPYNDIKGNQIGFVYVSICKKCGNVHSTKVTTERGI